MKNVPKVSWVKPKINHLAVLLDSYKRERHMTAEQIGKLVGCSGSNVRVQMSKPADQWQIGKLKLYCDALDIPYQDAVLAAIEK